jgi:hypothetical protein
MPAWQPGAVRVFASHLAQHKGEVAAVAAELEPYGFSVFVAHDAIEVSLQWRDEIENALTTCDCVVVFAHDGFHASKWTDQEVGWALGRGLPIVIVWYGGELQGFLERYQAIPVVPGQSARTLADTVFAALVEIDVLRTKVIDGLIRALGAAGSYVSAGVTSEALEMLGDELRRSDVIAILRCYESNDQVRHAIVANRPLRRLVERRAPDLVDQFWPTTAAD